MANQKQQGLFVKLLTSWDYFPILAVCLLVFDTLLSIAIVWKVPYTEIDWVAYMQEVSGFLQGERDYLKIRGDTGPLVYPGGFVYIYSVLYYLTDGGSQIHRAQYVFCAVYIATLALVLGIYERARIAPPWIVIPLVLSKRIHSLYMLRLFNDGIAAALAYGAIYLFCKHRWRIGCIIFSLAVSVKMNVLLYAPGLLLLLLCNTGFQETLVCLTICGAIQLIAGAPFLASHPISYLSKAFELSRVFLYSETVNFRFLPEEVFVSKTLAILLLVCHILTLYLAYRRYSPMPLSTPSAIFVVMVVSNFIGVVFARTLHYQFYSWYFHSLPALVYFGLWKWRMPPAIRVIACCVLLGCVELSFNVYRATWWSSALLQTTHASLLLLLLISHPRSTKED
eukprot:gb/GECG01008491.1/.p1 GENE.gb/GECG01008491.1/~~gb/GECG01008491.1/.p1  ORF type:complete len:395 (+),score=9.32 gb/GECG01008491.1/:1-1185(+)